jgi:adenylosuccinate lyase
MMTEHLMLGLVEKGLGRQQAHEILRVLAKKAFDDNESLSEIIKEDKQLLNYLSETEIDWYLDYKNYLGTAVEQVDNAIRMLKK